MEKLELYRKYRPTSFDEIVGNEITVKSLKKELENGSHVFLMTGPAGCGKTTLARIMAKEVGAGELSIKEINSAENRGIDSAREIMEQMRYLPSDGNSLVWILDEFHQQTSASQNAFLKAFEDTPEHVYFFVCTTDPHKLIKPLVSRCSVITVSPLKDEDMLKLLRRVAKKEGLKLSVDVLDKICEIAQGGCRRALKLLGKVLYLDSDDERMEALKKENAGNEGEETIEFCRALLKNSTPASLFKLLTKTDLSNPESVRQAVMGYCAAVLNRGINSLAVATIQAFSQADTYRNGKFALYVAILDRDEMLCSSEWRHGPGAQP